MRFRWLALTLFALSSVIILVAERHSIAPLFLIAIFGHWTVTAGFSAIGYVAMTIGVAISSNHKSSYPYLTVAGCSLLAGAISAAIQGGDPLGTLITAAPMACFFVWYQAIHWDQPDDSTTK